MAPARCQGVSLLNKLRVSNDSTYGHYHLFPVPDKLEMPRMPKEETTDRSQTMPALPAEREASSNGGAQDEDVASLRNEIIKYLSGEIESHSEYLMTFRSRIAFTVLIGPFVILGYVLVVSKPTATNYVGQEVALAFGAVAVSYLILGFCTSRLDQHCTDQCNKLRRAIIKVSAGKNLDETDLLIRDPVVWPYMAAFSSVIVAFFCIGWLLLALLPRVNLK